MPERVHVVVRIRPFIDSDPPDAELNTIVVDPTHVSVGKNRVFKVDRVYMMEEETAQIYAEWVQPLVSRFLRGFNASVLAYGQTGTGKTFTVQSLLPLLLRDVLENCAMSVAGVEAVPSPEACLQVQYVEVYGEVIRDLLDDSDNIEPSPRQQKIRLVTAPTVGPGKAALRRPSPTNAAARFSTREVPLLVHDDAAAEGHNDGDNDGDGGASPSTNTAAGCTLVGARLVSVSTVEHAADVIARGDARRATGATHVHEHSSRSHAILTLFHPRYACRLDIVDLAGSEREKKTGNVGVRFQESVAINTGLLALGNVIRALSRNSRLAQTHAAVREEVRGGAAVVRQQHVPYRSSRLTRLLQDTLGGNSATVFIACVAPDTYNRDESLRTLQYCSLALRVLNTPMRQYERLQRAQSPSERLRKATPAVIPLSLKGTDEMPADDEDIRSWRHFERQTTDAHNELLYRSQQRCAQLQSAHDELQAKFDAQTDTLANVHTLLTETRERLALCEQELRKDEHIFTRQIRAMQELVNENQVLQRKLARARSETDRKHLFDIDTDHHHPRDITSAVDEASSEAVDLLRDTLMTRAQAVAQGEASAQGLPAAAPSPPSAVAHPPIGRLQQALAARPPSALHSPDRRCDAPYTPAELVRVRSHGGVATSGSDGGGGGICIRDGRTPELPPAAVHRTPTPLPNERAAAAEPVQSFIRYILEQHGIDPEAPPVVDGAGGGGRSGRNGGRGGYRTAAAQAALAVSAMSSLRSSLRISGADATSSAAVLQSDLPSSRDLGPTAPPHASPLVAVLPEQTNVGPRSPGSLRKASSSSKPSEKAPMFHLANEVLRYHGANAELRKKLDVLQAELDGKRREAALLRLEVQDMKELYVT